MPITAFDHIHLRSPDAEGTARWFERMLGAEVIRSAQQGRPRIDINLAGMKFFIAEVGPGERVGDPPISPSQGVDHFGLFVKGLDALVAELKQKGAEFRKDVHLARPGVKACFLRGPQEITIELLERDV